MLSTSGTCCLANEETYYADIITINTDRDKNTYEARLHGVQLLRGQQGQLGAPLDVASVLSSAAHTGAILIAAANGVATNRFLMLFITLPPNKLISFFTSDVFLPV